MQAVQVVLFIVVAALALTLIGFLVRPRLGRRRELGSIRAPGQIPAPAVPEAAPAASAESVRAPGAAPPPAVAGAGAGVPGLVCPACRREYALGLKYCPHDARALV